MSLGARPAVVVGVDGSTPARLALSWAVQEAARRRLRVRLVHAYSPGDDDAVGVRRTGAAVLERAVLFARLLGPGTQVSGSLHEGAAAEALVAGSVTADTVVVGARGRGGLATAVLGSVSTEVAMRAQAPVVVVKDVEDPNRPRDTVTVGIDGSPASQACLAYAFEQAVSRDTGLDVVHAWSAEPAGWVPGATLLTATYRREAQGLLLLSEALAGWAERFPGVPVQRSVVHGDAVSALLSRSDGAQLLVVGSRGRSGLAGLVLGSVSHGVLQRAGCPVAVVRG